MAKRFIYNRWYSLFDGENLIQKGVTTIVAVLITSIVIGVVVGVGVYVVKPAEVGEEGHSDISMYMVAMGSRTDPVWITYGKGGETAAEELGIDFTLVYAGADLATQLNNLEIAIGAEPDAILFSWPHATMYDEKLKEAMDKGITVIGFSCDDPEEPKYRESFVGAGIMCYLVGKGEATLSQRTSPDGEPYIKDGAKILFTSSSPGASWSEDTKRGIVETLEGYGLILDENYTMDSLDTGEDPTEIESRERAYLIAHPDIDAVFSAGCVSAEGVIRAMEALGMEPGEIPCFMWCCGSDACRGIEEGYSPEGGVSVASPGYVGYMAVMSAFLKIEYEVTPSDIEIKPHIVDKTNVDLFKEGMEQHFF